MATKDEYAAKLRGLDHPYGGAIGMIRVATYDFDGDEFKTEVRAIIDALEEVTSEHLKRDRES